jgi:site-specific DNA recombinase
MTPLRAAVTVHALALRLRRERDLGSAGGRAVAQPRVLGGLVVCGRCRASCQLETSGKTVDGNRYRYCYYSCRTYCRAGKEECPGVRVATEVLDAAVLGHLADVVCAPARVDALEEVAKRRGLAVGDLAETWRALVTADHDVGRAYAMHLVERVELHDDRAVVVAKTAEAGV